MGIPSFYNKLLQTIAGLITFKQTIDHDLLAFDANCVIYHIHKKLQNDGVFYDHTKHSEYEDLLIKETIHYFMFVISEVNPKKGVYIALDGVVPFAKIMQQRRRRFKSVQTKKDENIIKKKSTPFFDTNCITPGTTFMDKLNKELIKLSETSKSKSIPIFVSTSDEFGEGEQKVMEFLRCNDKIYKSFLIYGLDADLIILSMLHSIKHSIPINLVREECEFTPDGSFSKLTYLNNNLLMNSLHSKYGNKDQTIQSFIYDFIGMMNLLGNDFVPHSYSLKIKDNGIETLLSMLQPITLKAKESLIQLSYTNNFNYNSTILIELFETLAKCEEHLILKKIQTKSTRTAGFFCKSSDPIEKEHAIYNDSPLVWKADELFVSSYSIDGKLKHNWNDIYNEHILYNNKQKAIDLYLESFAFTLDYYIGNPIDNDFHYPFFYSPLFNDIVSSMKVSKSGAKLVVKHNYKERSELKPIQQLVCVLPEDSFYLLPIHYKKLIEENPVYWPKSFDYFSIGKYYMYECEPIIPILHSSTVKKLTSMFEYFEKSEIKDDGDSEIIPLPSMRKLRF